MLKHSIVLKFNNVEMLKTMWKVLKTPAAGTCARSQNRKSDLDFLHRDDIIQNRRERKTP